MAQVNPYEGLVDSDIYCRVQDGSIVEYPVFGLHIRNRHHPVSWYTLVHFNKKPELPLFHTYQESIELFAGVPVVSYMTVALSYNQIMQTLTPSTPHIDPLAKPTAIDVATLTPEQVATIYQVTNNYFDGKMEALVAERHYRSVESCVGYFDSSIEKYKTEAVFVKNLRDTFWPALETYFNKVLAKEVDFPMTIQAIEAQVPAIAWPAE